MHSRSEVLGNNWVPVPTERECDGRDDVLDNEVKGKDVEKGAPKIIALQLENLSEKVNTNMAGANPNKDEEKLHKAQLELHNEKHAGDLRNRAADLNTSGAQIESAVMDIMNGLRKVSDTKDKVIYKNLSAFSRYNSGSTTNQAAVGNVGSCSPLDNSSEAVNTDSMKNFQSNSNNMPLNQQSNGSSNNNDMGSTTNNAFNKSTVISDKPKPKTIVPSSAFQPVQNDHTNTLQPPTQGKVDTVVGKKILAKARATDQQKRKERCFEKKVRYQSRKKLAEQRPRIRGQFVRQAQENKNNDTNC
ncbi:hypothetical protein V6N12_017755 [Hibiscus sabdariffa]|uniref:CCT domain-containing protein n=1 Tax=Hibiscus sabdariffa TaxID=183260 RepID=A0ABR2AHW7_9ROSI